MNNGTVTMPIEKYNEMLLELARLKAAFKLVKSYDGREIDVEIDREIVYPLLKDKLQQKFPEGYELYSETDMYIRSITIAREKDPELNDSEQDAIR